MTAQWPEAGDRVFPPPRRAEPEDLRQNILDELADHLALAAQDEMVNHGHEQPTAWRRAIERFGNPNAIARRLWWDAMREQIMREWFQTGLMVATGLVVLLMAVLVVNSIKEMQVTQVQLLETLQKVSQGSQPATEDLAIEVRRATPDGPPAQGVKVELSDISEKHNGTVHLVTDAEGKVKFSKVPQGAYQLLLNDPVSKMWLQKDHSLFAGVGGNVLIVAPEAAVERKVKLSSPLPYPNDRVLVATTLDRSKDVADFPWRWSTQLAVGNESLYQDGEPVAAWTLAPVDLDGIVLVAALKTPQGMLRSSILTRERPKVQLEGDTLVITPGPKVLKVVDNIAKNYTIITRWWKRDDLLEDNAPDYEPRVNGYVLAAIPVTDTMIVAPLDKGNGEIALMVEKKEGTENGILRPQQATAIKLPDVSTLATTYPAPCRFILSFKARKFQELKPLNTQKWPTTEGATFEAKVAQVPVPAVQPPDQNPTDPQKQIQADLTEAIRQDGALQGLLMRAESTPLKGDAIEDSPYLLVVSDTPPADL